MPDAAPPGFGESDDMPRPDRARQTERAQQEMRARVQEMQAKVIEAQAEVPLAIAQAFKAGKLGVMDFYRMQNIRTDTAMRESLAEGDKGNPK